MARLTYPAIAMLAIILVGLAFQPLHATLPRKAPAKAPIAQDPTVKILLNGFSNGWNFSTNVNPTIAVHMGDTVSLTLVSFDTTHRFLLDVDHDGSTTATCPTVDPCSFAFSTNTSYNFTVSFATGIYTYYCVLHPTTMLGNFVIEGSTEIGGGSRRVAA